MNPLLELLMVATVLLALVLLVARLLPARLAGLRHRVLLLGLVGLALAPARLLLRPVYRVAAAPAPVELPAPTLPRSGRSPLPIAAPEAPGSPWSGVALGLYGVGVGLCLIRILRDRAALGRLLRASSPVPVPAPFPVRLATAPTAPLACGIVVRQIVLPPPSAAWDEERLAVVVRHEAAHLRRRDPLWHLGAAIVCSLWWFHPLAWLCARRLRAEAESACDRLVLDSGIAPERYAHHLLEVAVMLKNHSLAPAMAPGTKLEGRLRSILAYTPGGAPRLATALVLLGSSALLPLVATRPLAKAQEAVPVQKRPEPQGSPVKGTEEKRARELEVRESQERKLLDEKRRAEKELVERKLALARQERVTVEVQRKREAEKQALLDQERQRHDQDIARLRASFTPQMEAIQEDLEELKLKLRDLDKRLTDKQLEIVANTSDFTPSHPASQANQRQIKALEGMIAETQKRRSELREQLQMLRLKQEAIR